MMRRAASLLLFIAALACPAAAQSRGLGIAMAVALLDVTRDYCGGTYTVDEAEKARLLAQFHEYDIAGLASVLSGPLNAFYEDFAHQAKQGRDAFCRSAPEKSARTGYPVILAGAP